MLLILTKSVNRCFEKNPKFDMTPLLGGTDVVFSSLIHSFSWFVSLFPFVMWFACVVKHVYFTHVCMYKNLYIYKSSFLEVKFSFANLSFGAPTPEGKGDEFMSSFLW